MPNAWGQSWGGDTGAWGVSWGEDGGAPPPVVEVSTGPAPSGGRPSPHPWITRRLKKRKPDEIQQVIDTVAFRQVQTLELDEQKRFEELERELEARGIEWESRYLELLNQERERLIHEEIGRLLRQKKKIRDEEEAVIALLMALL